jgi:hypothetical protein
MSDMSLSKGHRFGRCEAALAVTDTVRANGVHVRVFFLVVILRSAQNDMDGIRRKRYSCPGGETGERVLPRCVQSPSPCEGLLIPTYGG